MRTGIGILYLLNGLSMLIVWPMLIATGQVTELKTNLTYMCFHLSAEFMTAAICVITGLGLLLGKAWAKKLYFVSSGFFISAGYLAICFYLFSKQPTAATMLTILFTINIFSLIIFLLVVFKKMLLDISRKKMVFLFFNGLTIYTLINTAGFLAAMKSGYTYGYMSMIFLIVLYALWNVYDFMKAK
jgi:hypothetical protein